MIAPNETEYVRLAAEYDVIPVVKERMADMETPVSVLRRFVDRETVFLLESMEGGETWGRYSFVGVNPEPFMDVDHSHGPTGRMERLREVFQGVRVAPVPELPRFIGGVVGFLGYEAAGEFERLPTPKTATSPFALPRSRFVRANQVIVFDNLRHTIKIVVASRPALHGSPQAAYAAAMLAIEGIEATLSRSAEPVTETAGGAVEFASNMTPDAFRGMVVAAKRYIQAGDIIQTVLSQRFSAQTRLSTFTLYRALRMLNPSPYMFFLKIGGQTLVGSSPEVMVRLTGSRIEIRPIAGTRPRGNTEGRDRELASELLSDEKERAEHVMLVDLARNDIGRIAGTGSVQVTESMVVERYSHVMHLVSHVEGVLRKGLDAYDVIAASFPAGTLSGAPKIRAMEIVHELEPEPRGSYGGAVGYLGCDGNMDLAITIRTLDVRDGQIAVQAGAGIVYDSDPEREYQETCQKARALLAAVELAAHGLALGEGAR